MSFALTKSGNLYSWGLMDDGRLGLRQAKKQMMKSSFSSTPRQIKFTQDNIVSIKAVGSIAYCNVSGTTDLTGLHLSNNYSSRTYIWGKVPKGMMLKNQGQVLAVPTVFKNLNTYNFSNTFIQNDFAFGVGHSVALNF